MKLIMDEKLKHRLIGLAVIVSLGAIFAPAIMKKSSQNLSGNFRVNVQLPRKPLAPDVISTNEKELFKTIKIAKVTIPSVSEADHLSTISKLSKAEPIKSDVVSENKASKIVKVPIDSNKQSIPLLVTETVKNTAKNTILAVANKPIKRVPVIAMKSHIIQKNNKVAVRVVNKPQIKSDKYAVQLASFSKLKNAQALVTRLRNKGYQATFTKTASRHGVVYKVYAGQSSRKRDVIKVKTQLASAMQLNGFIVNTGVS